MRGRSLSLLSAALIAYGFSFAAQAQLDRIERKGTGATAVMPDSSAGQVDTTGVWYHLRHHDPEGAKTELRRLEAENPGWEPPEDLTEAFAAKPKPATKTAAASSYHHKVDAAEAAIDAGRIDAALRELAAREAEIARLSAEEAAKAARKDIDLGWAALNNHDPKRAAAYFAAAPPSEESRYGLILAVTQEDAGEDVLDAACGPQDRSARIAEACGDAFAARALKAYRANQWDQVIALDSRARNLGLARSGSGILTGWSHFRQGDYPAALRSFDAASSEPDAAAGIAQSLIAMGRYDELERRAAALPALAGPYLDQLGQLALIRQRPALAASAGAPGTQGYAAPAVSVGFYDRDKSGGAGADKIAEQGASLTVQEAVGRDLFSGGVESGRLGTGSGGPASILATPWVKWHRQDIDDDYSVTLGTSPIGGAVSALPVIGLSGQKDWQSVIAIATFKAQPRYDSLLSEAGMRNPITGAGWGRVMEIGPQIGAVLLATDKTALSGSLSASTLQGRDVESNSRASANLSASYSLDVAGFDYWRVGPFYGFDAYDKNENFVTPGTGGYYSPQASHSLGAFADFLTRQGETWLIGGRIGGSWQYARQSGEATETQLGTDATLRGGVLLGHGVILGGFGRVTVSPSGRDKAAGVTLTLPLAGRDGVFSADLPHFIDRSWP